jgi:hypothetical protein
MIRISGVARPGDKDGARKNLEARFTFWAGRAIQTRNVECGMARKDAKNSEFPIPNLATPDGPAHPAEARGDLRAKFFSRRCFLRAPPLPPGHKFTFAQERESQK